MPSALLTIGQAIRALRRAPGLGAAAILCIGLGAAATTLVAGLIAARRVAGVDPVQAMRTD